MVVNWARAEGSLSSDFRVGFEANASYDSQIVADTAAGRSIRTGSAGDLRRASARLLPAEADALPSFSRCSVSGSSRMLPTRLLPSTDRFSRGMSRFQYRYSPNVCVNDFAV